MFVRVFDNVSNAYFKSAVYAVLNGGWYEKQLVVFSFDGDKYFKLIDYLEKEDPSNPVVLINTIIPSFPKSAPEWMFKRSNDVDQILEDYNGLLNADIRFFEYRGYPWIYEDKHLLTELLNGKMVSIEKYKHLLITDDHYQNEGWHYIETQEDINFVLEQTSWFHDSVITKLNYVSGSYVDEHNTMHCTDSIRRLDIYVNSQWCKSIQMVFEGVTAFNLRPSADNHTSFIFDASLFLKDAIIFFCDGTLDHADKSYDGTWVESYSLRWKFLE